MKHLGHIGEGIGFVMILLGGGAMDSASLIAPIAIVLGGVVLMLAGASIEEGFR